MLRLAVGTALALALIASCSKPETTPAATAGNSAIPTSGAVKAEDFNSKLPVKELMAHVIDYNAFGIWHNQGWDIDSEGTHELFPQTDEGWHNAESAAITLAEASNLLLLPGRPQDDNRAWVDYAHALRETAMKAQAAAEKRDKQAFFDAGGEIYQVCTDCHNRYIVGAEPPPVAKLPDLPAKPN